MTAKFIDFIMLSAHVFCMLNFNIRGENIEVTPAIRDHVESKIGMVNNAVDVGVRVELPAPVFEPLTSKLYESKLVYYSPTFGDEVRTFCMNPNGEVVQENYNGIATVNGHSYAEKKTNTSSTIIKCCTPTFHPNNNKFPLKICL